jgi:DNA-binding CsgD family transcriptional regulator
VLDRVELGTRMLALGVADSDDDAVLWGRLWRADAFAQLGRINDAEAELTLLAPTVARLRSPGPDWHLRRSQAALAFGLRRAGRGLRRPGDRRRNPPVPAALRGPVRMQRAGLTIVDGSVRRYLGIAAAVLGHLDEAVRHLRAAIAANEREGLIARGLTNRQIAAALHISERTAENHVQHIMAKLGLHTRTQIAAWTADRTH